ncbi:MAG: hypothetical protein LBI61_01140 [Puniceicoccales bacterium]|nr:hypothetical protein [Puniceicoccales bacterium]
MAMAAARMRSSIFAGAFDLIEMSMSLSSKACSAASEAASYPQLFPTKTAEENAMVSEKTNPLMRRFMRKMRKIFPAEFKHFSAIIEKLQRNCHL